MIEGLVAKYFEEKENAGCYGGHASSDVRSHVAKFAEWLDNRHAETVMAIVEHHWFCPKCERSCLSPYSPSDTEWRVRCSDCGELYTVVARTAIAKATQS